VNDAAEVAKPDEDASAAADRDVDARAREVRARVRALVARVSRTVDLPPLPEVAERAMALARDPDAAVARVAQVVGTDAVLAARVIKIANSVTYLRRRPARTLQEAILTVGFQALRRIMIAASARATFPVDRKVAEDLWTHQLLSAIAADELAARAGRARGGSEFLAGLLHDVGRLLLHVAGPVACADESCTDHARHEARVYGFTHAEIGACLVQQWGTDHDVVEAVLTHHEPRSELASWLAFTDVLAKRVAGDADRPDDAALLACARRFGVADPLRIEDVVRTRFRNERALFM
jgi:HD-like signal output (HDOD) protein